MSQFKFSVGPWNVSDGADVFGPPTRTEIAFAEKVARFKKIGFHAIQFHDDDVVTDVDDKSAAEITKEAREVKKLLDDHGLAAEFVAPRLWENPILADGALTATNAKVREYTHNRCLRAVDIANEVGAPMIGFWFAREGTLCAESKNPVDGVNRIIEGLNKVLEYDKTKRIFIEPKPNEPIDRAFAPSMGHAMAISERTIDPSRVGGLVESAHAILAGFDPSFEMAFAASFGRLFGVHLNDQNGLKFDQDRSFGAENLRQAFNQVKVLVENDFGKKGEYVGLDIKAMRTQPQELSYKHLENSLRMVELLEAKVKSYDYKKAQGFIDALDYEALEMYVLEHILKG
jgi:xylose isomerase